MPPAPPWGRARPPPAAPSLPRLGFAFFWHRLLWGFLPFFGVSSVPLGSRVCVRGNIAIYNVSGGQGQSPGERDGGWGCLGAALLGGGHAGAPRPRACPLPPRLPLDQMWGQRGLRGHLGPYTPPPPAPPPGPVCPPGVPHVPSPPMSLRGRSPPRSATPTGGGTGLPGPPWSPRPCPAPAACTPTPCQHSDCMSLPLTDGQTAPYCTPPPPAPYLYPRSVLGVTCRCGSAPSGDVCTRPPHTPEMVGDPRPPLGY